jgi:hypothetical protein
MSSAAQKVRPANSRIYEHGPFLKKDRQQNATQKQANPFVQPKLSISQPGDKHETEADAVADKVIAGQGQAVQASFFKGKDGGNPGFLSLKQIQRSFFSDPAPDVDAGKGVPVQMKPSNNGKSIAPGSNSQTNATHSQITDISQTADKENSLLQKEGESTPSTQTNNGKQFEGRLNGSKGNGSPRPAPTR